MVPGSAAAVSPGNLLEMHVTRPGPRPTESQTLGRGGGGVGETAICSDKPFK